MPKATKKFFDHGFADAELQKVPFAMRLMPIKECLIYDIPLGASALVKGGDKPMVKVRLIWTPGILRGMGHYYIVSNPYVHFETGGSYYDMNLSESIPVSAASSSQGASLGVEFSEAELREIYEAITPESVYLAVKQSLLNARWRFAAPNK